VLIIYADHQKDARQRIMNEFNVTYPQTHDQMLAAYPTLTEQEYEICVLSHLPFRSKEIAQLFGVQENTVYRYRTVIRKKVGTDDLGALVGRFLG
jgi:FixJ family two-component response regulator